MSSANPSHEPLPEYAIWPTDPGPPLWSQRLAIPEGVWERARNMKTRQWSTWKFLRYIKCDCCGSITDSVYLSEYHGPVYKRK